MAYQQMIVGKLMRSIFVENGNDPEILGDRRSWGFSESLREKADREEGFCDLIENNMRKPSKETGEQTLAARVEQLEHDYECEEDSQAYERVQAMLPNPKSEPVSPVGKAMQTSNVAPNAVNREFTSHGARNL